MRAFALTNRRPFRLILAENGRHQFGGTAWHAGIVPKGCRVPAQLLITLDLTDPLMPIENTLGVTQLPLYYPFKYGMGGAHIQYTLQSDSKLNILYVNSEPDEKESQYLQIDEFPSARMALEPLTYEQSRILRFCENDLYFKSSDEDRKILKELDSPNLLIEVGGQRNFIRNAGDIICHNPRCEFFERRVYFEAVALVPALPIGGTDAFWHEYQGTGEVTFCFGFCYYCGTVIGFNVAS